MIRDEPPSNYIRTTEIAWVVDTGAMTAELCQRWVRVSIPDATGIWVRLTTIYLETPH